MNLKEQLLKFKKKNPILFNVTSILLLFYVLYRVGYVLGQALAHLYH